MSLLNHDSPPILIATVGLPRSGKSTWAKKQGIPIVNPDGIRYALHGTMWREESEPMVWGIAQTMVRSLFNAGHDRVLLDATNVSPEARRKWETNEWLNLWVMFRASEVTCIVRATTGDRGDLVKVVQKMAQWLEWPINRALLPRQLQKPLSKYSYPALVRVLDSVKTLNPQGSPTNGEDTGTRSTRRKRVQS